MNEINFWRLLLPISTTFTPKDSLKHIDIASLDIVEGNVISVNEDKNITVVELRDVKNPLTIVSLPPPSNGSPVRAARSQLPHYSNFHDLIIILDQLFSISCLTGLIIPSLSSLQKSSDDNKIKNKFRRYWYWVTWLHISTFIFTLAFCGFFFLDYYLYHSDSFGVVFFQFANTVGVVLQNFLLFPTVIYVRKSFFLSRRINLNEYSSVLPGTLSATKKLIWVFNFLTFLLVISLSVANSSNSLFIVINAIEGFFFASSNYFCGGIYFYLVLEQRVSYNKIYQLYSKLQQKQLTRQEYLEVYYELKARDEILPISLFVTIALVNTLVILVVIAQLPYYSKGSVDVIFLILYVISVFGRQLIMLILVLYEILKVNSLSDRMIHHLSKDYWGLDQLPLTRSHGSSSSSFSGPLSTTPVIED
jgi:hypothetical protein